MNKNRLHFVIENDDVPKNKFFYRARNIEFNGYTIPYISVCYEFISHYHGLIPNFNSYNLLKDKYKLSISRINPKKKDWHKVTLLPDGFFISNNKKFADHVMHKEKLIQLGFNHNQNTNKITLWVKLTSIE